MPPPKLALPSRQACWLVPVAAIWRYSDRKRQTKERERERDRESVSTSILHGVCAPWSWPQSPRYRLRELGPIFWPSLRRSAQAPTSKAVRGNVAINRILGNQKGRPFHGGSAPLTRPLVPLTGDSFPLQASLCSCRSRAWGISLCP